jgi:chitodextrinase
LVSAALATVLGASLVLVVTYESAAVPPPFNYGEALQKSIWFYEAQVSGDKPSWNRVAWRGDSFMNDVIGGVDLTGGYHDAGDHIKATFPMAHSMATLAWGIVEWPSAYTDSGQRQHLLNNLRWGMDWLIKGHPSPNKLVALVGDPSTDHQHWQAAEVMEYGRQAWYIDSACAGTDLAAGTAAAFAAASMAFAGSDSAYAATLLTHARQLYTFAETAPQKEYENCAPVGGIYESWSGYRDELVWGAIWLSRATSGTESSNYLAKAQAGYANLPREEGTTLPKYKWTYDWDDKTIASEILLAKLTGNAQYITDATRWIDYTTDRTNGYNGQKATYSPGGQIFYLNWGSLRYAAGSAFLAFVAADSARFDATRSQRLIDFAKKQTNYALGDNPSNLSYMVGFSKNGGAYVRRPHHRTEHGSWTDQVYEPVESRHTLYGALVGGPPAADDNYGAEDRNKYDKAEVALDFNAPLVGNLARMYADHGGAPLASFPPTEATDGPEMFVEGSINQQGTQPGPYLEVKAFIRNKSAWPARHLDNANFRYYFTLDAGVLPSQVAVTAAYNQCSAPTGPTQFSGNVYFIAVSCAGQRISPRGQSDWRREVQFRIAFLAGSTHNFTQDWSYQGIGTSSTTLGQMPRLQLFDGSASVWGTAPGATTPPGAPGQPAASNITSTSATLTWTAATPGSNPIAAYDVYRVGTPDAVVASTTGALTATVTGLTASTAYTFFVRARDTSGTSGAASPNRAVTTLAGPTPPGAPGQPTASSITPTAVTLTWTAAAPGANPIAGYDVYRVAVPDVVVASTTTALTTTVTGLSPATSYTFYVRARDNTGVSGAVSASRTVTTAAATPPSAPGTPTPVGVTATSVNLSWTASTAGTNPVAGYEVHRVVGGVDTVVATPTSTAASITGLTPATAYTFYVRARDSLGILSAASPSVAVTTLTGTTASCTVTYAFTNTWGTGATVNITIANSGTTAINGWTLAFAFPNNQTIQPTGWHATWTQTGANVTATNLSWNSTIAANASIGVGFNLNHNGTNNEPTAFTLNGQACTVG